MQLLRFIDFIVQGDERGQLVALEGMHNIPFVIKRVYYIFGVSSGISRGFHAHRRLKQVVVAVSGRCRILLDDGRERVDAWLDSPDRGLVVGDMVWREMHDFSDGCVLMILASEYYDEGDYIRDYDAFRGLCDA
ncbi:sugar 3,4-ketoisomerase [Manganibacter manganicus]|uniref:dTDP-6-deoxy-3,4-keto-hexulose isomerase n=1 Tax=Manganibacter manganicus TaxID=1873176 RepID=A0A1V8RSY6_9HYPH|nr:FdtA/QdtA family cupin domain-containing protein [Pseudaminobacter manganicus]OQM76234.1 dTDP-6-deoxy-3,4-keto-hexulose isomerase [Pseudaminobacter manganicus]